MVEVTEAHYSEAKSAAEVESLLESLSKAGTLAVAFETIEPVAAARRRRRSSQPEESMLPLLGCPLEARSGALQQRRDLRDSRLRAPPSRSTSPRGVRLKSALADPKPPRPCTTTKPRCTRCAPPDIDFAGVQHDTRLYSYLLDPTYSSHRSPTSRCAASI